MKKKTIINGNEIWATAKAEWYMNELLAYRVNLLEIPDQYMEEVKSLVALSGVSLDQFINIDTLIKHKRDELNEKCKEAIEAGIEFNGNRFRMAVVPDQVNIALSGLQFSANPEGTVSWESESGESIDMDLSTFMQFSMTFASHLTYNLGKVRGLKRALVVLRENIENGHPESESRKELNTINW